MTMTKSEIGESTHQASLRPVVAAMDAKVAQLGRGTPNEARGDVAEVLESWAALVEVIALGPAPEMRECPVCKHRGLRAATRCGFCWTALPRAATGTRCTDEGGG